MCLFHNYLYAHNERGPFDVKKCSDCMFRWCGKCGKTQMSCLDPYEYTHYWKNIPSEQERKETERHLYVVNGGERL